MDVLVMGHFVLRKSAAMNADDAPVQTPARRLA
jgi:hypothetical protein